MQTILGAGGPIADELARAPEFYGPGKTKSLTIRWCSTVSGRANARLSR
ncbi:MULTISPECIES: hypothetical protein [Dermacoccus]|nr:MULTISPECIES: hypothetical protein [Dermacoccus]